MKLHSSLLRWGFRCLCRCALAAGRLLYGLEIHGRENLPLEGPAIIIGRHCSRADFLGTAFLCSAVRELYGITGSLAFVGKPALAWLVRAVGAFPSSSIRGALSAGSLLELFAQLQQGKIVFMGAPEGEVSWDGRIQPFRLGAAWLALRAQAPIIIIVGQGAYDIWPRWAARPHLTGKLILRIGKPFLLNEARTRRVTEAMLREANLRIRAEMEAVSMGYLSGRGKGP